MLDQREQYRPDVVVLLQPTSPFRRADHIDAAVDLLISSGADSVVTVVQVPHQFTPASLMRLRGDRLDPFTEGPTDTRRQDKPRPVRAQRPRRRRHAVARPARGARPLRRRHARRRDVARGLVRHRRGVRSGGRRAADGVAFGMKVLFFAAHYAYYRNFESAIVALAERGHHVHLAADERESLGGQALVERLAARYPRVTFGFAPSLDDEPWFLLARKLRTARDYIRFHDEAFAAFRKTRLTLRDRIPRIVLWLMDAGLEKSRPARHGARSRAPRSRGRDADQRGESRVHHAAGPRRHPACLDDRMAAAADRPSAGGARARQTHRRVRIQLGSPLQQGAAAHVPDRVLLWNETQKREAIKWHGMPADRIVVTGAQCYDQWFDRTPSRDRASFCRAVGLEPDRPLLLYVCSVMTPNPYESRFVQRWIEAIRRSPDDRVRNAGILVRPHPERTEEWEGVSLERFGNAVLYGRNPVSPEAQADYFDSLYHSHAVVGLVTSAFLEAAIVGRPVHTLLLPEFEMYQEGVQHFRYLMEVEGGLLKVTRTFPEHLAELSESLARPVGRDEQNARFVRAFVRPAGLDLPATPAFVEAVEHIASSVPLAAEVPGFAHDAMQPLVRVIADSAVDGWLRPALRDATEMTIDHARARKAAHKHAAAEDRERRVAEKREFLALRRRERQRQHWVGARRKQLARIKGRLKDFVSFSS